MLQNILFLCNYIINNQLRFVWALKSRVREPKFKISIKDFSWNNYLQIIGHFR